MLQHAVALCYLLPHSLRVYRNKLLSSVWGILATLLQFFVLPYVCVCTDGTTALFDWSTEQLLECLLVDIDHWPLASQLPSSYAAAMADLMHLVHPTPCSLLLFLGLPLDSSIFLLPASPNVSILYFCGAHLSRLRCFRSFDCGCWWSFAGGGQRIGNSRYLLAAISLVLCLKTS